ncbi:MAG: adenosine deaminase, partial [Proteobacteria bacterium]|nr:adenosine deaminase [Pseudomonadota bacterium]
ENLVRLQEETGIGIETIGKLVRNAFEISWLDPDRRSEYLAGIDAFVAGR